MPIIIGKRSKETYIDYNYTDTWKISKFTLDIDDIAKKYRYLITPATRLQIYLSRVFNEELKTVCEPKKFAIVDVLYSRAYNNGWKEGNFSVDVHDLATELSIPDGYFMEILAISWINSKNGQKIVFPNETRIDAEKMVEPRIVERIESLRKIGSMQQSQSILSQFGLKHVVEELSAGYADFEKGDTDGTIKHYRKVIEGYKNSLVQKESVDGKNEYKLLIDNSTDRTEKVVDFLKKTFNLLSNFGEHIGTTVSDDERILANGLVEDLTEYITKKLEKKSLTSPSI
jgi:hypothetical protein